MKIDRTSMKNGSKWRKNENPCFKNLFGVMVLDLSIKEGEESPSFLEGRNENSQNGFFTIGSHGWELSGSILRFEIGWAKTELLQFEDLGRQWN